MLSSTNISADDQKSTIKVIEKFKEYFKVCKNMIYERARFNRHNKLDRETAEEYITVLYVLVKTCYYKAELVDKVLFDRLVVGIRNKALSDKQQVKANLTIESTKKSIRQGEAVREQRRELARDSRQGHSVMEDMTRRSTHKHRGRGASQNSREENKSSLSWTWELKSQPSQTPPTKHCRE